MMAVDGSELKAFTRPIRVSHIMEIPCDCNCTWVPIGNEMVRKFVNNFCPHHAGERQSGGQKFGTF